ncbi:MAG: response regulator [Lachnospiraceae bacterium]|nr:response regulator [Lachnospiraceae bacterium]
MRILAVDDEKLALDSLTDAIREASPEAELFAFQSPREVLAWAEKNIADVAFLDVRMRGMTGLELALRLKNFWPGINIIFATGYDEYLLPAVNMRCSGYLLKPVQSDAVREELQNLRNPVAVRQKHIHASTFGHFELFVEGVSVSFENARCKELLAFLIDRNGAAVNNNVIAAAMYEDSDNEASSLAQVRKAKVSLKNSLKRAGIEEILKEENRSLSVDKTKMSCDYWQMLDGSTEALRAFGGEYMSGYSWGEVTLAGILFQKQ